jgi:hypothetical protein|tara:strand:+ start:4651 stop:5037 length:387 start_codon:yes stop_codon:yes gene_type:complete
MAKARPGIGPQTALIDIDRDSEFTGDDVDQYSKLVDLGIECSGVLIKLPVMTSSTISVYGQEDSSTATVPFIIHRLRPDAQTSEAWTTTASTGSLFIHCDVMGGIRYIRVRANTNQGSDRSVTLVGTN